MKYALVALIPILGFILLPAEVASHFNALGAADSSMPRGIFILTFTLLSSVLAFGIPQISRIIPSSADERINTIIRLYGLSFSVWMLLFFILVIIANAQKDPSVATVLIWVISVILLLPLVVLVIPSQKPNQSP